MTDVEICNLALGLIGASPIVTFDDGSAEAKLCKVKYPVARDTLLKIRLWSFAKTKFSPDESLPAPAFGFAHAFAIPTTVLEVWKADDGAGTWDVRWEKVGAQMHSDATKLYVVGTARLTDTSRFPPDFCEALGTHIAADLAIPLSQNRELLQDLMVLAERKTKEAVTSDSMQGVTERVKPSRLAQRR